jgi:alanine racemase
MEYDAKNRYLAWAEIDLDAVRHNYAETRRITGGKEILAVVKCNAYGNGAVAVAQTLEKEGVKFFGVAGVAEAIDLREGEIKADILNLAPFAPEEAKSIIEHNIVQSVFLRKEVEALDNAAAAAGTKARVHVKVDTGLGRLGVHHDEANRFIDSLDEFENVSMEGIFSVLAEDRKFDPVQLERLKAVYGLLRTVSASPIRLHLSSSAAVIDFPESHLDMVRPGIMLLGIYPNERSKKKRDVELIPALSFKTQVARVALLPKGEKISYHRTYTAEEDIYIATLPVGYTIGYPRNAAGKAEVLINGKRFPLIADINATAAIVNIEKDNSVSEGDEVVLIGKQGGKSISADDLGVATGISAYQIVASLSPKLPRITINE